MSLYAGIIATTGLTTFYYREEKVFSEVTAASGGTAPYTYQWQRKNDCYNWTNDGGTNPLTATIKQYATPACPITYTRRIVTDNVGVTGASNTIALTFSFYDNVYNEIITDFDYKSVSITWNNYYTASPTKGITIWNMYFKIYRASDSGDTQTYTIYTGIGGTLPTSYKINNLLPNTTYNAYIETFLYSDFYGTDLTQSKKITFTTDSITYGNLIISFNHNGAGWNANTPEILAIDSNDNIYYLHDATTYNGINVNKHISKVNSITGALDTGFNIIIGTGFINIPNYEFFNIQNDKPLISVGSNSSFNGVSIQSGGLLRLNSDGSIDSTFNFNNGGYYTVAYYVDSGNKIIAFRYNGTLGNGILIRINSNGTVDSTFNSGVVGDENLNKITWAIAQDNAGKYIKVGSFTTYSGVTANRIIRLNYDGTIDSTFNSGTGFNAQVNNVAIDANNKIYCTGRFTTYSGVTANRIIRLNSDGTIDSTFNSGTGFNGNTQGLFVDSNNKILIGGDINATSFSTYNGITANGIIRLNYDGTIDSFFDSGIGLSLNGITLTGNKFFLPDSEGNTYTTFSDYYDNNPMGVNVAKIYSNSTFPNSFCETASYIISASTCGNADGSIKISDYIYFNYYDFTLTDVWGNNYLFNYNSEATGLTSGYYFLTATVKPAYWYYYGRDDCNFDWIPLEDTDTSISLLATKIKHAICQGFGKQTGRIILELTDSGTTTGWTYTLYDENQVLIDQQTLTGSTFTGTTNITTYLGAGKYYAIIENDSGCKYLSDLIKIQSEQLYTVTGIQKLFITPWSATTSYNYYSSSDEDWYVTGIDTLQYTSTKIKEYVDLADFWYQIKLDTAVMSYGETFQKDQNGLTYAETVTISIPKAENSKWRYLKDILTGRYIILFQDFHDQYWTCGYRYGMDIKAYSLSENQYIITFRHPSVNKMLTAIDSLYVKNNVL